MNDTAAIDTVTIDRIASRQASLKATSDELKAHFVGLDAVIDKIILSITAWYCMPELLTRPTIVNLWGLTGNGKTDLVRRLVKSIDFMDNFVEIQMTNKGSSQSTYATSLQGLLGGSNIAPEEPGVLLLDEIQRFRSVDSEGKEIHDYVFQDLWMLLSDGSFGSASDNKQQIMELLLDAIYWDDFAQAQKLAAEKIKKKKIAAGEDDDEDEEDNEQKKEQQAEAESRRKFKQTYWHAKQLKRKLRLAESVEEIMKWDTGKKMNMLTEKLNDKSIYRPEIYSKLLIFISGNLDEAYSMSSQTEETDVDADLFHKHSLRINLLSIKNALKSRFKPEQIARFGNTHVIYPALSKSSYETIIHRKVNEVIRSINNSANIDFSCDQSVYDAIYRNGVFPVQGTRPVFSTISSFFESMLPTFALKALQNRVKKTRLFYDKKCLCADLGGDLFKISNEGDIDRIKKDKRNEHQIRKVSVHEVGHAIIYAYLFGYIPTQVAVLVASDDKAGFIGLHSIERSYNHLIWQIRCLMGGRVAEEIIFGKENVTDGASGDIQQATTLAAMIVRIYGMGDTISRLDIKGSSSAIYHNLDLNNSNEAIEKTLLKEKMVAEKILRSKLGLLKQMSDHLAKYEKISNEKFKFLCKDYGIECEYLDAKETIQPKYHDLYNGFWENNDVD